MTLSRLHRARSPKITKLSRATFLCRKNRNIFGSDKQPFVYSNQRSPSFLSRIVSRENVLHPCHFCLSRSARETGIRVIRNDDLTNVPGQKPLADPGVRRSPSWKNIKHAAALPRCWRFFKFSFRDRSGQVAVTPESTLSSITGENEGKIYQIGR